MSVEQFREHAMHDEEPMIQKENQPLLSIDDLRSELAALESNSFTSMSDDELKNRIRLLHDRFEVTRPICHPGKMICRAVRVTERPRHKARLSYPPADRVLVNGRLNRAGQVMFYGTFGGYEVCLRESRYAVGDLLAVSVWKTIEPLMFHHFGYSKEVFSKARTIREIPTWAQHSADSERNALIRAWQARVFTRLIADGQEHLYRLSIALTDFALQPLVQSDPALPSFCAGVQYPSVSLWLQGDNIALLPSAVDRSLSLEGVALIKVESITDSLTEDGSAKQICEIREQEYCNGSMPSGHLIWNKDSTISSVPSWQITDSTF
jgi:predicted Fe-S protein YdhL (DUF1289 family)